MAQATGTISFLIGARLGRKGQGWDKNETRANVIPQDLMKTARTAEEQTCQHSPQVIASLNEMNRQNGFGVCTSVGIANCTGADMKLIESHSYHGHIGRYPLETTIGPGQTAVFIHTRTALSVYGSKAALIYQVVTPTNHKKDVILAFNVSLRPPSRNPHRTRRAYVQIKNTGHYEINEVLRQVRQTIVSSNDSERNNIEKNEGLIVEGNIGQSYSPICQFTVKYDSTLGDPTV